MDKTRIPDGITPLLGYRAWQVSDKGMLVSCYRNQAWPIDEPIESECIKVKNRNEWGHPVLNRHYFVNTSHMSPSWDCTCGIYALDNLPNFSDNTPWGSEALVGMILAWGTIIKGEKGFRAEFARPVGLVERKKQSMIPKIDLISTNYDIPVYSQKDARGLKNGYWQT